jgi:hypothetical protein
LLNASPIAGDVDYGAHGHGYGRQRRTDPRLAAWVHAALGDARTILNSRRQPPHPACARRRRAYGAGDDLPGVVVFDAPGGVAP